MTEYQVPQFLWFMITGKGLFIGVIMLVLAAQLSLLKTNLLTKLIAFLLALLGSVAIFLSATPFPILLNICLKFTITVWILTLAFNMLPKRNLSRITSFTLIGLSLIATLIELSYFTYPEIPETPYTKMYLIGDSISAGVGTAEEMTWPKIVRRQNNIELIDLSIAGATVGSALKRQIPHIEADDAIVLLEISGNDSLQSTSLLNYERDLKSILEKVSTPDKLVIMLEVPVLPWHTSYAKIQRKLAREFDVILIPKRFLISVFSRPGNTVDLAHLSQQGHEYIAQKIWKTIGNAFDSDRID